MKEKGKLEEETKVPISGYISLAFAVIFFSGLFSTATGWTKALDFQSYLGSFGIIGENSSTFVGSGGGVLEMAFYKQYRLHL